MKRPEELHNVDFLDMKCDDFDIEICTSNYKEHKVIMSFTEHCNEDCFETLLSDEQIDKLIQALESAKDLKQARIQQNEVVAEPRNWGD